MFHEFRASINMDNFHAQIFSKSFHNLLGFIQAQQAVVHKYAGELRANGTMQ